MNKLIDLGSHKFEGLNVLLNTGIIDSSYRVYCFEANPNVYHQALEKIQENIQKVDTIHLYNCAISNKNEIINFNLDQSKTNQACNILPEPPAEDVVWGGSYTWTQIQIKSISAKTLLKICDIKPEDKVKIKCDIEGAEFEFLWDLLTCDNLSTISEIMVEWHERFWHPTQEPKILEKNQLIEQFKNKNILIKFWD
jgi:FkbM family methyltransferase